MTPVQTIGFEAVDYLGALKFFLFTIKSGALYNSLNNISTIII